MTGEPAWTELGLEAREVGGPERCHWVLTGPDGQILARHAMNLDPNCSQYEAIGDLAGYIRRHAAPDMRDVQEREIVRDLGTWISEEVLGPVAAALVECAPAVVRVVVPADVPAARRLLFWPLQLAHVRGRPIALQDVTLVMESGVNRVRRPTAAGGGALRILALFSLPQGSRALNLRHERLALTRLFAEAAATGRGLETRTLQYGVTRERLRAVLAHPDGWDLIHVSGHGTPGELMLETDTGQPDRIRAAELADLLAAARGLQLVTLSACWSAASATREQRRLLNLPAGTDDPGAAEALPAGPAGAIASELADRLGCAVLAMRYPIDDGFAKALAERLYLALVVEGQSLPRSLATALKQGVEPAALQAATPALFGAGAADLSFTVPRRSGSSASDARAAAAGPGRPLAPERFVGRVALLARASAALSPGSGLSGVLLQGMPGAGKTACAAELAATHEHAFDHVVWFKLPDAEESPGSLTELALVLEQAVDGFRCAHWPDDAGRFEKFADQLADCLERHRLLLVIDHIDALLAGNGTWRDQRWSLLMARLTGHQGQGRLILTSRAHPRAMGPRMRTEPVGMLTLDEALLLARELPHLARLVDGHLAGATASDARRFAARLLEFAQGHPKLLELLDGQAVDVDRLVSTVGSAGRAWAEAGGLPAGFFTTGQATANGDDYVRVLGAWSDGTASNLSPEYRDLFFFLCHLPEDDRTRAVVEHIWPRLRTLDGRDHAGEPSDTGLRALTACGLLTLRPTTGHADEYYEIQPAVAAQGRIQSGEAFRQTADTLMSAYWLRIFDMAWTREGSDAERADMAGPLITRAGLSACPYLIGRREWKGTEALLTAVLRRDDSRPTVARVLPILRKLAATAASGTGAEPPTEALTRILTTTDPAAAERLARAALAAALDRQDYAAASAQTSTLIMLCVRTGRLDQALTLADDAIGYPQRAGLGVWSGFHSEVQRLHVLVQRARPEEVLGEVAELGRRMSAASRDLGEAESVRWWEVWEEFHDTAQRAAIDTGQWQQALEYNGEVYGSKRARGAPPADLAQSWFPAYMPLLRLGRVDEALTLLEQCRDIFEHVDDFMALGEVLGALANIEDARGHGDVAIARGRDSLRYAYRAGVPSCIAVSHANMGTYLHVYARDGAGAMAHHLAAALLGTITGGRTVIAVPAVTGDLQEFGATAAPPAGVEELCARVGEVPGVVLDPLLRRLAPDPAHLRRTLADLIRDARGHVSESADTTAPAVWGAVWEPVLAALVAAARGNTAAAVKLRQHLTALDRLSPQFAPLTAILRRIHDGERGPALLTGLGPLDAMVAVRALEALTGEATVPVELWPAMHLGLALGNLVAAATGHQATAEGARETLDDFGADPILAPMASVLGEILAGNRDPGFATRLRDPTQRAVVTTVLRHIVSVETAAR